MSDFDKHFWPWVPRRHHGQRDNKGYARQCYTKAVKRVGKERVHAGVRAWNASVKHLKGDERKGIRHASTWCNQNGWEDHEPDDTPKVVKAPVQLRYNGVCQATRQRAVIAQQRLIDEIGEAEYRSWFTDLTLNEVYGKPYYVASSPFFRAYIRDHFADAIRRAWGEPVEVVV